jgi:methionyl-tRNA formyltransferase
LSKPLVILSGQKWLGEQTLQLLINRGWRIAGVAAPASDRLFEMASKLGLPCDSPAAIERLLPETGADILVCADHRDFLPAPIRARFNLGVLAFHGSFLPRHRGGSAVEWTVRFGDPIAGASIYWMDDGMDTGPLAAREAVMVQPGEFASALWRRAIAPTGLALFNKVFADIEQGIINRIPQEEFAATWEPMLRTEKGKANL